MALPPPSSDFVAGILGEYDRGVAVSRRESLSDEERVIDDWLISIEAVATFQARVHHRLPGFVTLALGAEGSSRADSRPVATAFVRPEAYPDGLPDALSLEIPATANPVAIDLQIEPWELRPHADLRDGTVTCWVHLGDRRHAMLTARHVVVQDDWGQPFAELDEGGAAALLWHSPNCLDASVLDAPEPQAFAWLIPVPPTESAAVEVLTKRGSIPRTIKAFNHTFGSYASRSPHLIWLDEPLQPGDSGSLVVDGEGRAIGMYIAAHDTPQHGPLGLCQGLMQLEELFRENGASGFCLPREDGH
jgi:hypothetical protein